MLLVAIAMLILDPMPCFAVCHGRILDSLQAAETLDGCTIINGSLEVQLAGGSKDFF